MEEVFTGGFLLFFRALNKGLSLVVRRITEQLFFGLGGFLPGPGFKLSEGSKNTHETR